MYHVTERGQMTSKLRPNYLRPLRFLSICPYIFGIVGLKKYIFYTICVHNQNTVGHGNGQIHLFYPLKMFKKVHCWLKKRHQEAHFS